MSLSSDILSMTHKDFQTAYGGPISLGKFLEMQALALLAGSAATSDAVFGTDNMLVKSDGTGRKLQSTCVRVLDGAWTAPKYDGGVDHPYAMVTVGTDITTGIGTHTFYSGIRYRSPTYGICSFEANNDAGSAADGTLGATNHGHLVALQCRDVFNSSGTLNAWYGVFNQPILNGGTTTQILNFYWNAFTGVGAATAQYGLRCNSQVGATFNAPIALDGPADADANRNGGAGSAQRDSSIWLGYQLTVGKNINGNNAYQVDVTPQKSTINGRGALLVSGGTFSGSSGTQKLVAIDHTVTQTSSAAYTALEIAITENSVGSGASSLIKCLVGGSAMFTVNNKGTIAINRTITAGGTTGAQPIDKPAGTVNFAAASASLVVTNNQVTTSSIVLAVVRTNDSTAKIKNVVPANGSFTINLEAAATAETSVGFLVIN